MRYWYLKGGDVLGPLSAQEIANDSDFSAEALVCPEPNSGDETFWKTPSMYAEDFGPFIKEATVIKAKPAAKDIRIAPVVTPAKAEVSIPAAAPVAASAVKEPVHTAEYADLAAVSPEETIHSQSPLNAALENNLLEDLPAKAVLAKDEPKEEIKEEPKAEVKTAEVKKEEKKAEEKPHPADPLIAVIENQKPLQAFREEDFTLAAPARAAVKPAQTTPKESDKEGTIFRQKQEHAAPVVMKAAPVSPLQKTKITPAEPVVERAAKTPLPVETFGAGSGVIHIKEEGEEIPVLKEELKDKSSVKEKSFFSSMAEEKPVHHTSEETDAPFPFGGEMKTAEVSELIKEEQTGPFLQVKEQKPRKPSVKEIVEEEDPLIPASAGDRVAGGIMPTTNGKIISSSDGRLEDKKPKNDVIYLLVISMVLFTGIALFMTFFGSKKEDKKTATPTNLTQTNHTESSPSPVLQGIGEGIASPEVQSSAPVKTPDIANDKGAVVQHDAEEGKTKAQDIVKKYLLDENRGTIADFLSATYGGGYQMSWSASPLYADTYVVDFTASKVRAEPIVYLFRVDIKKGVVTGGLNGITMDLLADK